MATDISDTATTVEEIAVGAAKTAAQVANNPVGTARRQVKSFERRGTPTVRRFNRRLNALIPDRLTLFGVPVNGKLPEKMAIKGLHMVKLQARRPDVIGDVAKQTLRVFNGSFKEIARTATRLEEASELTPHRETAHKPVTRRRTARRRTARRRAA